MKTNSKNLGLVTKKFNDFFFVDLKNKENIGNSERFLCKVRKSINFKDQFIYVGDKVEIDNIDLTSKRAVISSLIKRQNLFFLIKTILTVQGISILLFLNSQEILDFLIDIACQNL